MTASRILKVCLSIIGGLLAFILVCHVSFSANLNPLPDGLRADLVVIEKSRHRLTLYEDKRPLRSYPVSLGRGGLQPKEREGDRRTPEGTYKIDGRNADSVFHLSLHISYPDAGDVKAAKETGTSPGSNIMIHGLRNGTGWIGTLHRRMDWTAGCVAVTNPEIEEIWRVVPDGTRVEIKP